MTHIFNTVEPRVIERIDCNELFGKNFDLFENIRIESQFFNASPSFLDSGGGRSFITKRIVKMFREKFEDDLQYHHLVINSYCHKIPREGIYGNIPGWHCDFAKQEHEEAKTSVEEDEGVKHWIIVLGSDDAPIPQFIRQRNIRLEDVNIKESSWNSVSKIIDRRVKSIWPTHQFRLNELVEIRGNELYRAMPSTNWCWRMYLRITQYPENHPYRPIHGKLRKLNMVYMGCENY
jgi:hypothetical protein